jgi:hypothetical protein
MKNAEIVPQGDWKLAQQERGIRQLEAMSIEELVGQVALIQNAMKAVMKEGTHYGRIPGVDKPSLFKPGAEVLSMLFRLDVQFETFEAWDGRHLTVKSRCTIYHSPTGRRLGSGEGSCSTKESRYAYRQAQRKCPACGVEAIIKGKEEYGGGWICFKKKNGCGAKYREGDQRIESQSAGRVDNEDIADQYNTVLKMANKRSHAAAVLVVTAASDIFTQDVEDLPQFEREPEPKADHVKRYTPEELEAAKTKPEPPRREEKPTTPPEEGFGDPASEADQRYGAPLNQQQLTALHAKIGEKAKRLGVEPDAIKAKILREYRVESSKDLGQDVWSSVLTMILKLKTADLGGAQ